MTERPTGHLAGVLALQGGFAAHSRALEQLNWQVREVRVPADLIGLEALVLPGGESTTMTLGIEREDLAQPLAEFVASGKPVLATCAGAILLGDANLSSLDITYDRNAYGGQIHSFEHELEVEGLETPFCGVFIRAPRITRMGADVETLATLDGDPVVVRSDRVIALTFHPELTDDNRLHELAFGRA